MTASRILRGKGDRVVTIGPEATVRDAVGVLGENNIGAIVVSRDGASVDGILSERDIVRGLRSDGEALLDRRVADVMVSDVITCEPTDPARKLLARMTERRIRHLPVVENGKLTGIISIGDVVKLRLDDLMHEAEAMRQYITQ